MLTLFLLIFNRLTNRTNMNKDNLTQQIGVRFYKDDIDKIQKKAQKERINLSAYVRKVVSIAVEK